KRPPHPAHQPEAVGADALHAGAMPVRRPDPAPRLGDDGLADGHDFLPWEQVKERSTTSPFFRRHPGPCAPKAHHESQDPAASSRGTRVLMRDQRSLPLIEGERCGCTYRARPWNSRATPRPARADAEKTECTDNPAAVRARPLARPA